jgi:hypothetical protein
VSDTYKLFQAAFLRIIDCADSTYFWVKDIPLHFLIGFTAQIERLLNLHSPIGDKPSDKGLTGNLLYICFYDFSTSQFRISNEPGFVFSVNLD